MNPYIEKKRDLALQQRFADYMRRLNSRVAHVGLVPGVTPYLVDDGAGSWDYVCKETLAADDDERTLSDGSRLIRMFPDA